MLSISEPMKDAGKGNYYLKLAREDYYTRKEEPHSQWIGTGAERLNLRGAVNPQSFHNLLSGRSPDGKRALVQNADSHSRQCGWDFTFSAPKSVSVLLAVSNEETQNAIRLAHAAAVEDGLRFLEETAGITRRGKGGRIKEKAALAFATFEHMTSRAQDPQLHTHSFLINLGLRSDGTTGSLQSNKLFEAKMAAGAHYQSRLAQGLRERLGVTIEKEKTGFHIQGVPREACAAFSKRRKVIVEHLQENVGDAIAAKKVTLATRKSKEDVPREILFQRWRDEAESMGWTHERAQHLVRQPKTHSKTEKEFTRAVEKEVEKVFPEKRTPECITRIVAKIARDVPVRDEVARVVLERERAKAESRLFHVEYPRAFQKAPNWSPIRDLRVPVARIGNPRPFRRWGNIRRRQGLVLGELRIQERKMFPRAPKWSPISKIENPALRFVFGVKKMKKNSREHRNDLTHYH